VEIGWPSQANLRDDLQEPKNAAGAEKRAISGQKGGWGVLLQNSPQTDDSG
jgi:hypothetical protein